MKNEWEIARTIAALLEISSTGREYRSSVADIALVSPVIDAIENGLEIEEAIAGEDTRERLEEILRLGGVAALAGIIRSTHKEAAGSS